jgi:SWI/SNF-related matrix-associated actin-dependent regulator 1 of chromatin subfamily A
MKTYEIDNEKNIIRIRFRMPDRMEWRNTLDNVKTLIQRQFNPSTKTWTAPHLPDNITLLESFGFSEDSPEVEIEEALPKVEIDKSLIPELRPYQIENLEFWSQRGGRGLCGDEMGLGKTVSSLSYLKINPEKLPALIIVTASTKFQWAREFSKWVSPNHYVQVLSGRTPSAYMREDITYIINWDILKDWADTLCDLSFGAIIADEIQAIGNPKNLRTKAFQKLCKIKNNGKPIDVLALSGTPFTSGAWQFFTILNILNKELFPNRWRYYERYCDLQYNGFGADYKNGASNIEELHQLCKKIMIRHTKRECLKDLPGKIVTVVPLAVKDRSGYDSKAGEIDWKNVTEKQLQQLNDGVFRHKSKEVIQWIDEFLESGEKLVVYAWHREVVDFLYNHYSKIAVKVYGGVTGQARDNAIQSFIKEDKKKLFVANILSGGVGIDGLQKVCSNMAFVELYYNPASHWQAEDRLDRFGQEICVNCNYLVMEDSIESDIMDTLDSKAEVFRKIMDGKSVEEINLFKELLKKYRGEF